MIYNVITAISEQVSVIFTCTDNKQLFYCSTHACQLYIYNSLVGHRKVQGSRAVGHFPTNLSDQ